MTSRPPKSPSSAPETLEFTGAVHGTMTAGDRGPQKSDAACTHGSWHIVGRVGSMQYKLTLQHRSSSNNDSLVEPSEAVGPTRGVRAQVYTAVVGKESFATNSDDRSGTVDAELVPAHGSGTVHVKGDWHSTPTS